MKKFMVPFLVILGLVFLAIAIYYWVTPAGSLPHFVPGYQAGSKNVHLKHGLVALVMAAGCGILAWFQSGNKKSTSASNSSEK